VIALLLAALGGLWWALQSRPIEPLAYLPRGAPVVLCQRAEDPEAEIEIERSHWFATLPLLQAPAGTFASSMQPRVFRDLGFAAGQRVCAAPIVPPLQRIEAQRANAAALGAADESLQSLVDGCVCAELRKVGRLSWAPRCGRIKNVTRCPDQSARLTRFEEALAELEVLLPAERPRLHWRVVGSLGRTGRFPVSASEHLEWLDYPGRVSTPEKLATGDEQDPLVRALLAVPDVTAVIRQGRGHAVLVVREIGDIQVLDYFENLASSKRWGTDWGVLDRDMLGARLESMLALPGTENTMLSQLEQTPGKPHEWLSTAHGLVHLDHGRLDDYDRLLLAAREVDGEHYDETLETRTRDELLMDELTLAWNDQSTRGRVRLTLEGQAWWGNPVDGEFIVQHAAARLEEPTRPEFKPAMEHDFVLRGQPLELGVFDALRGFPRIIDAAFNVDANGVSGDAANFRVELPEGRVAGEIQTAPGLVALQSYLSTRPHAMSVKVDAPNGFALFELEAN
jgi:hypothetical protein